MSVIEGSSQQDDSDEEELYDEDKSPKSARLNVKPTGLRGRRKLSNAKKPLEKPSRLQALAKDQSWMRHPNKEDFERLRML